MPRALPRKPSRTPPRKLPARSATRNALPREEWVTRGEASRITGASVSSIRRAEARLDVQVREGVHYLRREHVEELRRSGLLAAPQGRGARVAGAFRLLARGATLADLCVALGATMSEAEELAADYARGSASSSRVLDASHVERLRVAGIEACTLEELIEAAVALARRRARP